MEWFLGATQTLRTLQPGQTDDPFFFASDLVPEERAALHQVVALAVAAVVVAAGLAVRGERLGRHRRRGGAGRRVAPLRQHPPQPETSALKKLSSGIARETNLAV